MVDNPHSTERLRFWRFLLLEEPSPSDFVWSQDLPSIVTGNTIRLRGRSYQKCRCLLLWLCMFESIRRIRCLRGIFDGKGSMLSMTTSPCLSTRRLRVPSTPFPLQGGENTMGQALLLDNCSNTCRILDSTEPLSASKCHEWIPWSCVEQAQFRVLFSAGWVPYFATFQ